MCRRHEFAAGFYGACISIKFRSLPIRLSFKYSPNLNRTFSVTKQERCTQYEEFSALLSSITTHY